MNHMQLYYTYIHVTYIALIYLNPKTHKPFLYGIQGAPVLDSAPARPPQSRISPCHCCSGVKKRGTVDKSLVILHSFQLCGKQMIQDFPAHLPTPTSSFFVSFSTGQLRVLFIHVLGHLQETQPLQDEQKKLKNCIANIYHSKQNVHMVPEMGGFPKTFRRIVAALLYKSTCGSLSILLTELFVHRHVFDSVCVERNAAVFKITSFAIACVLSCRLIVDAATPCGTGSFMVLLHCFELFGMKIFMTGTNCCHQHQRKEHHSHHDH